jgi:hypothetical protein
MKKFGTAIIVVTLGAGLAVSASAPSQAAEGRNAAAAIGFGAGAAVGAAAAGAANPSYAGPGYREVYAEEPACRTVIRRHVNRFGERVVVRPRLRLSGYRSLRNRVAVQCGFL